MVYTVLHTFLPSRSIVVEAINHGAVAVHQNRPAISVLLVCLHTDPKQENHTPVRARRAVPSIIQHDVEFSAGSLEERGRGNKEDKVHPHMLAMALEWPAVDKLLAEEVFMPNVQAAEDLCLRPLSASAAAIVSSSLLHAPHQPSDLVLIELIVLPICRPPEANGPVAAIVMQVTARFLPEVFQNRVCLAIVQVC